MATFGYLLFRSAFALAEQIAPSLTGRAAFELFCRTPDPDRVTGREAAERVPLWGCCRGSCARCGGR